LTANQRLALVAAVTAAVLWTVIAVDAWIDGTPVAMAALLATGILAGGVGLAAAMIAAGNWAMRGRR
jgi:hypothetical protein